MGTRCKTCDGRGIVMRMNDGTKDGPLKWREECPDCEGPVSSAATFFEDARRQFYTEPPMVARPAGGPIAFNKAQAREAKRIASELILGNGSAWEGLRLLKFLDVAIAAAPHHDPDAADTVIGTIRAPEGDCLACQLNVQDIACTCPPAKGNDHA